VTFPLSARGLSAASTASVNTIVIIFLPLFRKTEDQPETTTFSRENRNFSIAFSLISSLQLSLFSRQSNLITFFIILDE
jgi:hypothetical protein